MQQVRTRTGEDDDGARGALDDVRREEHQVARLERVLVRELGGAQQRLRLASQLRIVHLLYTNNVQCVLCSQRWMRATSESCVVEQRMNSSTCLESVRIDDAHVGRHAVASLQLDHIAYRQVLGTNTLANTVAKDGANLHARLDLKYSASH